MIKIESDINIKTENITRVILQREKIKAELFSFGASLYSLKINNKEMTLRPENLEEFLFSEFYYGKTVGRTSGRLIVPSYSIDGKMYQVNPYPPGKTKLHGGKTGFSFRNFDIVKYQDLQNESYVIFCYISKDGEEEYPGELTLLVRYSIDDELNFRIEFKANTTKDTLCNITNHSYFNLSNQGTILNHKLKISARKRVEIDADLLPKKLVKVENTLFDFNQYALLRNRLEILSKTSLNGYDNAFLFQNSIGSLNLLNDKDGICMDITTNYPAVVIFTHNIPFKDTFPTKYKNGIHSSIAIECQYEPGGIHFKKWNHAILKKHDTYQHWINYHFIIN